MNILDWQRWPGNDVIVHKAIINGCINVKANVSKLLLPPLATNVRIWKSSVRLAKPPPGQDAHDKINQFGGLHGQYRHQSNERRLTGEELLHKQTTIRLQQLLYIVQSLGQAGRSMEYLNTLASYHA